MIDFFPTGNFFESLYETLDFWYFNIQERYVCSRLKQHPTEDRFLAQTHGNYIAVFSINRPYKLDKYRRFEGHKVRQLIQQNVMRDTRVCPDCIVRSLNPSPVHVVVPVG